MASGFPGMKLSAMKSGSRALLQTMQATRSIAGFGQQHKEQNKDDLSQGLQLSTSVPSVSTTSTLSTHDVLNWDICQQDVPRKLLLKVRSNDPASLESYTQFVTRAARVFDINCSGKVVLPIKDQIPLAPDYYGIQYQYKKPKKFGNGIQIKHVKTNKSDIFLNYIQERKPEGVSLKVTDEQEPEKIYFPDL